jgi:tetratricopeptide (TPR) repeat protein
MPRHALDALARLGDPARFGFHALYLWGEALRGLERYHEAIIPLVRASEAAPEDVHVWFALAWCYKRTGQIEMAIDSLERALANQPREALVHYNLACYWSLAGNRREALEYLARALHIDPEYRRLIEGEPDFDLIRSDPEFRALCRGAAAGDLPRQR